MLAFLLACAQPGIPTEGYDTTCSVDEDCNAVPVGDVCACTCEFAAVSEAGLEAWAEDRDLYFATGCPQGDTCECPDYEASCNAGSCELR